VAYHASPENEEVAGGAALPFDVHRPETLAQLLARLLDDEGAASVWKERARQRVRERYCWEDVVSRYERLLAEGRVEAGSVLP
jgi:glycosyltransferase involved in cell wall biosynthesis